MRSNQLDHTAVICPVSVFYLTHLRPAFRHLSFNMLFGSFRRSSTSLPPPPTRYSSNSSISRRRHGGEETKGPKRRARVVWAISTFFFIVQFIHERTQRPTAANEGQHWHTKRKRGPNDASHVVWALGVFYFIF